MSGILALLTSAQVGKADKPDGAKKPEGSKKKPSQKSDEFQPAQKGPLQSGIMDSMRAPRMPYYQSVRLDDARGQKVQADLMKLLGFKKDTSLAEAFRDARSVPDLLGSGQEVLITRVNLLIDGKQRELTVRYSPQAKKQLEAEADEQEVKLYVAGYPPLIVMSFNSDGDIQGILHLGDPFNTLGRILKNNGFRDLAAHLKEAPKADLPFYHQFVKSEKEGLSKLPVFRGSLDNAEYVKDGSAKTCDLNVPLVTDDISTCALVIIDKDKEQHSLFLLYGGVTDKISDENQATIKNLISSHSRESKYYMVFTGSGTQRGHENTSRAEELFRLLRNSRIPEEQIYTVPSDHRDLESIILDKGKLYKTYGSVIDEEGNSQAIIRDLSELKSKK